MKFATVVSLLAMLVLFGGCGADRQSLRAEPPKPLDLPKYKEMKNISEAPEALRQAARAIVKLVTYDGGHGTATFISPDGLILTNNHVLGMEDVSCAREGCHVKIYQNLQTGTPFVEGLTVFAEPVQVSAEADAAIFQLWTNNSPTKRKITSPHYLLFESQTARQLMGQTIHIVGHPLGSVKKWTSGRVFGQRGTWIYATNYTLPGNSGSPYLNDQGKIIGLHHRHSVGNDLINRRDAMYHAIGTASSELAGLLAARRRTDLFFSVNEAHSIADIADNHDAYWMAYKGTARTNTGADVPLLTVLGEKCDRALDVNDFLSPEDMEKQLGWCSRAWAWINCRDPEDGRGYKTCPTGDSKTQWNDRFTRAAVKAQAFNSHRFYRWLVSPGRLETSRAVIQRVEMARLNQFFARANPAPRLGFELAFYLLEAGAGTASYEGVNVADFVKNYRTQPNYHYHYDWVIDGHETLYKDGVLAQADFREAIRRIFADENLMIGDKLNLELLALTLGFL